MSKARSLADLGNVYDDGALSNRNLIINGAMQVAQRGTSHSVTSAYTLDRWLVAASVTATVTKEEDTVDGKKVSVIKSAASGSTYNAIIQRIEGMRRIQGQTYTLSAWVKGTVATETQYAEFRNSSGTVVDTLSQSHTFNGNWQKFEWTFEAPTNASYDNDNAWFNVSFYGGDELSITMVQLEVGDTATPFEHRSYGDELARCQRYYEQIEYPVNGAVANCHAYSTAGVHGAFYYNEKRANPTISVSNGVMCYRGTTAQTPTTLNWVYASKRSVNINPVNGMTFTTNDASYVIANSSGLSVKIDAEL